MARSAFSGNSSHTMDAKGRVTIPAAYRDQLGDDFTITLNFERSAVVLYPEGYWETIEEGLENIPPTDADARRYQRLILSNAFTGCQVDAQGRVLVPPPLRQLLNMGKNVRFVGMGKSLELWDEERYAEQMKTDEQDGDELLKYVNKMYYMPRA